MNDSPPYLLLTHSDVDLAHDGAFNRWYDEQHLPDLVGQPGFVRARRYVCVEGEQLKYLAIYEFEREENRKTPEYAKVRGTGPMTPHVRGLTIGVFRNIFKYEKPEAPGGDRAAISESPPCLLVVHSDVDPAHDKAFNRWYNEQHLPDLIGQPGFVRARRYVRVEGDQLKYLATYEFQREENRKTPEYAKVRGMGPMTPHVRGLSIGAFRSIFTYEKPGSPAGDRAR